MMSSPVVIVNPDVMYGSKKMQGKNILAIQRKVSAPFASMSKIRESIKL